jgi:hypothetical protein
MPDTPELSADEQFSDQSVRDVISDALASPKAMPIAEVAEFARQIVAEHPDLFEENKLDVFAAYVELLVRERMRNSSMVVQRSRKPMPTWREMMS